MHSLSHFRPAMQQAHFIFRYDFYDDIAEIGHTVAHSAVLDTAGKAFIPGFVVKRLNRFQGCAYANASAEHLPGGGHPAFGKGIVVPELPAVESTLTAKVIDTAFQGKTYLVGPEAAHGPRRDIVGVNRECFHLHAGDMISPRGVTGHPFHHLGANGGVGAGIADGLYFQTRKASVMIASYGNVHKYRVPLRVHPDRLIPAEHNFYRLFQQPCE